MNRLKSAELRKKAAVATAALIGMIGLTGCTDIYGGGDGIKTVPEAKVYKQEGDIIQPAMLKVARRAITFWQSRKDKQFDAKNDAYELKDGPHNYSLTINTQRDGRYYGIDVDLREPKDPNSVYDVDVNSASDANFEFGIGFDLSTKPWSASSTNYYTDYTTKKKKMQVYGDSTDNYMPGIEEVDGYNGFLQTDADQALKISRQTARAAEHAVAKATSNEG